jgi:hypothetical protein
MFDFIVQYWTGIAFSLLTGAITLCYRHLKKEVEARVEEHRVVKKAITAILRQTIYDSYNKWSEKGYCPIYAMEVATKVYEQYHALGGNDVGTELYERLKELPTQPLHKENEKELVKEE